MHLTKSFLKSLAPCVIACTQALSPAGASSEPLPYGEPVTISAVEEAHSSPNAQLTYMEWKKRLYEARYAVAVETQAAVSLASRADAGAPGPAPA